MLTDEEKKMVGGSDGSAIAGLNPNKSPHAVWRRIVEGFDEPAGKAARRGTLMEPVIRSMAAEDFGLTLLGPRKLKDPRRAFMRSNLDDVNQADDGPEVVEFKSVSGFAAKEYGEADDAFPLIHHCQVQIYLALSGFKRARLIALIGMDDLRQYFVESNPEIQGMLFEHIDRFWVDHVLTRKPPPEDASEGCAEWLAARYPVAKGPVVQATPEAERWATQLQAAKLAKDAAEYREEEAKNHLKALCGDASSIEGRGWRAAWSNVKGRTALEVEALLKELNPPAAILAKHTIQKPGYRAFRSTFQNGESK
jgi:predicted phage-related endonuclease